MPSFGSLQTWPNSAIAGTASSPDFNPKSGVTHLRQGFEPNSISILLGAPVAEFNDDGKQEKVGEGSEEGNIGAIRNQKAEEGLSSLIDVNDGDEKATLLELVREWSKRKMDQGVPEFKCALSFLVGAPKLVHCGVCRQGVFPQEKMVCTVRGCGAVFHHNCVEQLKCLPFSSSKQFKCPQHACFLCYQKNQLWRCKRCPIACHVKCAPFPEHVVYFPDRPGEAICWRHHIDWRFEKNGFPVHNTENIFPLLPLAYGEEEFKIDLNWKLELDTRVNPDPYVHIRRNIYLIKRPRRDIDTESGCRNCSPSSCSDSCVCRVSCISCSKACLCSKNCGNRPFQKDKKVKIVKTQLCGWGVVAAEPINKGDFVIEYVGEVIDDSLCERRLFKLRWKDAKNFYMCEITKDFVIDATLKGNASRFLNHSCAPNCKLEKWQVDGEVRVGIFASTSIEIGEPLTYDYQFVQFGPQVCCHCGAPNCCGRLGKAVIGPRSRREGRKSVLELPPWGLKRKRNVSSRV